MARVSAISVKRVPGVVVERCHTAAQAVHEHYASDGPWTRGVKSPYPIPRHWRGQRDVINCEIIQMRCDEEWGHRDDAVVFVPPPFADTQYHLRFFVDAALADCHSVEPTLVHSSTVKHRDFWWFTRELYVSTDQALSPADVAALVNEGGNRRRLQLEKAHALAAMTRQLDERTRRQPIPQQVKLLVWQRDGGRCVECGSQENLEFDHVIPLAMGGSNTDRNLQLLCEVCNNRKGATLG